jgi:glycosyltransferase involved in cell wall biosynthesis
MNISAVIPTVNRRESLLRLLRSLAESNHPLHEIIIVDAGEDGLTEADLRLFPELNIKILHSAKSVCVQRNIGIRAAQGSWIFLCDDDLEIPRSYLETLSRFVKQNEGIGAISGLVKEKHGSEWVSEHPVSSAVSLLWRFIFQLGIWGEIEEKKISPLLRPVVEYYRKKGNHISSAGWPVITTFSKPDFSTPIYSLGASLIRREWLLMSPFDELLDPHGVGDNYGVALGFPGKVHVVGSVYVYHHKEMKNRLKESEQFLRRSLALHYFISTRASFRVRAKLWFYWSGIGNALYFLLSLNRMFFASCYVLFITVLGLNPLLKKYRNAQLKQARI